ncbi:MAG: hypothetical protein IPF70_16255 [Saprospiraceae bacterium]|nr:hypothetical protein [Saprospiraceae bacterium]
MTRRGDGQYVFAMARVEIDEKLMTQVSEMTGGKYYRATDEEALQKIYDEIDKLEKTGRSNKIYQVQRPFIILSVWRPCY